MNTHLQKTHLVAKYTLHASALNHLPQCLPILHKSLARRPLRAILNANARLLCNSEIQAQPSRARRTAKARQITETLQTAV
jgi:hypothetical protein